MKRQLSHQECADGVIDIMTALNYHPSTIKSYRNVFDDFIRYSNERGKTSYEEALAIEYAGMITGKELKELSLPEGYFRDCSGRANDKHHDPGKKEYNDRPQSSRHV